MSPETAGFRHFHDQLQTLKERLLDMSGRAEELVDLAVASLLTRDKEKADAVISGDRALDMMELEFENLAVSLLALQQPMARDLRFIISAIKITSDLERVGDHAVNIAQSALRLIALHVEITPTPEIEDMARRARKHAGRRARRVHSRRWRPGARGVQGRRCRRCACTTRSFASC